MPILLLPIEETATAALHAVVVLFEVEGLDFGHRFWRRADDRSRGHFGGLSGPRLTQLELDQVSSRAKYLRL